MNRLDQWTVAGNSAGSVSSAGELATSGVAHGSSVPAHRTQLGIGQYHTLGPIHYEPNYAYPLLVWLPDLGGNAREICRVMPLICLRNYVGVGVNGVRTVQPYRPEAGYHWGDKLGDIHRASEYVESAVDAASRRYHIHPQRVFLCGHGEGGTLAIRLAMLHPESYAGAISLGGGLPQGNTPFVRLGDARRVPLLMLYGRDSDSYGVSQVCTDLRVMHTAGLKVALRQYPCGQEVTTKMLSDINSWVMGIVTGNPQESLCDDTSSGFAN